MTSIKARILLIEGKRSERTHMVAGLTKKGYQVVSVASGSAALERAVDHKPDVFVVDAASMRTSGRRICQSLRTKMANVPILLIAEAEDEKSGADVTLIPPFTLQKLLNRIKLLLPVQQNNVFQVGPIQLESEQRWVRCGERQTLLTPRLVHLLRLLMEHQGQVIERESLFTQVWETEYTGDTRTLDVHMSWLRQAVEEDPRHPRYIKTVRGMGYRLDIDEIPPHLKE